VRHACSFTEKMMLGLSRKCVSRMPSRGLLYSTQWWQFAGWLTIGLLPVLGFGDEEKKAAPIAPPKIAIQAIRMLPKVAITVKTEVAVEKPAKQAMAAAVEGPKAQRDEVASDPATNGAAARDKSGDPETSAPNVGKGAKRKEPEIEEPAADEVVADPFEQQFKRQFGSVMKAELFFLNSTCQTTAEQRQPLKIASDTALSKVVKRFVDIQKKMNNGGFDWNTPSPDPRRHMQDELVIVAKQNLFAEQVALYEAEIAKRVENRRRTSILNVVARLDDELILTAEQRTKLTAELTRRWKAADQQQMEIFVQGEHYFPNIPEQFVTGALNDRQKEIWRGLGRSGNIFFGIGNFGNVVINDAAWAEDPPLAAPQDAAETANQKEKKDKGEAQPIEQKAADLVVPIGAVITIELSDKPGNAPNDDVPVKNDVEEKPKQEQPKRDQPKEDQPKP
jgi:hypothetical protein